MIVVDAVLEFVLRGTGTPKDKGDVCLFVIKVNRRLVKVKVCFVVYFNGETEKERK